MKKFNINYLKDKKVACLVSGGPISLYALSILSKYKDIGSIRAYTFSDLQYTKDIIESGFNIPIYSRKDTGDLPLSVLALLPELIIDGIDTVVIGIGKDTPGSHDYVMRFGEMKKFIKNVFDYDINFVYPALGHTTQMIEQIYATDELKPYRHLVNSNNRTGIAPYSTSMLNHLPVVGDYNYFGLTEQVINDWAKDDTILMPKFDGWIYDISDKCIRRNINGDLSHIAYVESDSVGDHITQHCLD